MLSTSELERALAAVGLHAPVRFEEVTGSTNATALRLAGEGTPEWTLVATNHQTAGRGRMGRAWIDRPGGALMCSFVLRPTTLEPEAAGLIPLLAGAAMCEAAAEVSGGDVRCAWPNDLFLDGRKVGGILVESAVEDGRLRHVVVGAGVNLIAPPDVPDAAALGAVDPATLLTAFLVAFTAGYLVDDVGFADRVRARWRERSAMIHTDVEVFAHDGSSIFGRAVDVDERGALMIETDRGLATVTSGDVRRLRRA